MQVVPVEEPAPVSGVVVGVVTEQPGASSGVVDQTLAMLDGLADEGGRGSLEFLGRWNDKRDDRAMPVKLTDVRDTVPMVRVAFCKLVDELVQTNATSGTLAISNSKEVYHGDEHSMGGEYTAWVIFWSASPDDLSYQRHGAVKQAGRLEAQLAAAEAKKSMAFAFADFKGVVDDFGGEDQIAVYRVTLPSRGLDPDKWVGRPPPPAPEELYTGPRRDGLLSTDEVSGEYSAPCCVDGPVICNSMTVVPLGADMIEIHSSGCAFFPPLLLCGPGGGGKVKTRQPGTNVFGEGVREWYAVGRSVGEMRRDMTFLADGTAKSEEECCGFKKRPTSQKRSFQKVETRDLAGTWCGCSCLPFVPLWPILLMEGDLLSCTTKKVLNEDQYAESGCRSILCLPIPVCDTRTRLYMHGHVTNGFAKDGGIDWWCCTLLQHLLCIRHARKCGGGDFDDFDWYHDPSYTRKKKELVGISFFAKKIG